jgi:hypothetical protein
MKARALIAMAGPLVMAAALASCGISGPASAAGTTASPPAHPAVSPTPASVRDGYVAAVTGAARAFDDVFTQQPTACRTDPGKTYQRCAAAAGASRAGAERFLAVLDSLTPPAELQTGHQGVVRALGEVVSSEDGVLATIAARDYDGVPATLDILHAASVDLLDAFCQVGVAQPPTCIP